MFLQKRIHFVQGRTSFVDFRRIDFRVHIVHLLQIGLHAFQGLQFGTLDIKIQEIKRLTIPPNSYIMPAGMYGQFIYYVIEKKENVIGFLDNNPDRHTKTLYGTDKYVYLPNSIDYTNVTIVICECPYKEELIAGIKSINKYVNILCL
jgi:hypothetical protein